MTTAHLKDIEMSPSRWSRAPWPGFEGSRQAWRMRLGERPCRHCLSPSPIFRHLEYRHHCSLSRTLTLCHSFPEPGLGFSLETQCVQLRALLPIRLPRSGPERLIIGKWSPPVLVFKIPIDS